MEGLYNIGQVSKISGVAVATLRYYDEIGLLKPKKVDAQSGYRYYSGDQIDRLDVIVYLKNLGFALKSIQTIMYESRTPRSLHMLLEDQIDSIDKQIMELMWKRSSLRNKSLQLQNIYYGTDVDIVFQKEINERHVLSVTPENVSPTYNHASFGYYVHQLTNQLEDEQFSEYRMGSCIPWERFKQDEYIFYEQIFLDVSAAKSLARLKTSVIPGGRYVCIKYHWSPDNCKQSFHALKEYVEANHLDVEQYAYEVPIITGQPVLMGDNYILEIQLKILS